MSSVRSLPTLDVYLAVTMRSSPDLELRLVSAGAADLLLEVAKSRHRAAGLMNPLAVTKQMLVQEFGAPLECSPEVMTYPLALWPEHLFDWKLEAWGGASAPGFRLRAPRHLPQRFAADIAVTAEELEPWRDTSHEVVSLLALRMRISVGVPLGHGATSEAPR